jgi:drug/metabolite transporter (DMT)-like permease
MSMPISKGLFQILKNWKSSLIIASIALVAICAVWGSTFLIVQKAVGQMPVMDFLAVRFTAAALVMFALRPTCFHGMTRQGLRRGMGLGVVLGAGYITQTYGLRYASATVSGFITGMFVVFTPVISWLILRKKVNRNTIFAVVLATAGLALLSLHGWTVGSGELLTLACAIFFAIHIVGLGEWSAKYEAYGFALIQIATVAVIALLAALPGGLKLPPDAGTWGTVGITAVFATALAFLVQTWTQSLVPAVTAAIIMTMEPVFAGIFGVFFGKNHLTLQIIFGAVCVLTAMLIVALKSSPKTAQPGN